MTAPQIALQCRGTWQAQAPALCDMLQELLQAAAPNAQLEQRHNITEDETRFVLQLNVARLDAHGIQGQMRWRPNAHASWYSGPEQVLLVQDAALSETMLRRFLEQLLERSAIPLPTQTVQP